MKKIMNVLVISTLLIILLIISSCKVEETTNIQTEFVDINESLLDYKYCQIDEDCVLGEYIKFDCCGGGGCPIGALNKEADNERSKWREQNCKEDWETISQLNIDDVPEKWLSCFEYAECITIDNFVVKCIDNRCEIIDIRTG